MVPLKVVAVGMAMAEWVSVIMGLYETPSQGVNGSLNGSTLVRQYDTEEVTSLASQGQREC